jgi:hypothetical protein
MEHEMNEIIGWGVLSGFAVIGLSIVAFVVLRGWQGWLDLKRSELAGSRISPTGERIDLADLKARIRKLEAIAACVDP